MNLKTQRTIAARVLRCSPERVVFARDHLSDIKESITRQDMRSLVGQGIISKLPKRGGSRVRARKRQIQKRKGRLRGQGSRKGKKTARLSKKDKWMTKIRVQRGFLKRLIDKEKISTKDYRNLYQKAKGGFFRNKRHIQLYIDEKGIFKK